MLAKGSSKYSCFKASSTDASLNSSRNAYPILRFTISKTAGSSPPPLLVLSFSIRLNRLKIFIGINIDSNYLCRHSYGMTLAWRKSAEAQATELYLWRT